MTNTVLGIALLGAVALVALAGVTDAGTHGLPPLFREDPNSRMIRDNRADVNYRLPNTTVPEHYDVQLTTNVHTGEKAFTGVVRINLNVVEETSSIVLHSRQQTILSATIWSRDVAAPPVIEMKFEYNTEVEFLTLTRSVAGTPFAKDSNWTLSISYTAELRSDNGGFYLSTYLDENKATHYLATTQFESTDARHAFPCYDEPAKRAQFTITINHDKSYSAISNMPVNDAQSTDGVTVFQTTVNMPTYLVAFIVSDFKWSEGRLKGFPQRIYSRPGTQDDQEWALVSGMLILERLADYYNVSFALPKMDQVAVPDFAAGAMENFGLVTYREEYLLYNQEKSTVNTQTNVANIIAHEFCHQWFGNLVAVKWWTYLWLKEGFATLFSYRATDDAYPEWGVWQQFHIDDYHRALNGDAFTSSRPMTHYVQKPREISALYDYASYSKAGSVLYMWQNALSDKVFQRGLNNYLETNAFNSAEEMQLFVALENAAKEENHIVGDRIRDMMVGWTQQSGYPLITVTRDYNTGAFKLTQTPFYNDETVKSDKLWYVPVNYVRQSQPDFRNTSVARYIRNVSTIDVTDFKVESNEWLILNKQSTGYYRINYDDRNWELITNGLIASPYKVHPRNRAQLMHDAYRFSSSNRLKHNILLELMTYLKNEDQYAPWSTANSIITTFNRYLSGDSQYAHFKAYVADLVSPIYEKLGVNDIPGEQHFQKYTRSVVINLACLAGIDSCLAETNGKLTALINDGIEIEPNLQTQTYCNGLRKSEDTAFFYVHDKLMNSEDQAQRRILISSLGCSQTQTQIAAFIAGSIDMSNKLRTQERTTLLSSAYTRGEIGLLACIDFLDTNWEAYAALQSGFGGSNQLDDDIRAMSQQVFNKNQEAKMLALVEKVKGSDKLTSNLETAVKANIESNYNWLKTNRDPLMTWIVRARTGGSASVTTSFMSISLAVGFVFVVSRLF